MDKFALVFEFNKESPLITYKASKELDAKNYSKALDLIASANEKFPNHILTYFIYSLALAYNKKYTEAEEILKQGHARLGDENTYNYYLNKIDIIKREAEGISLSFDDTVNQVLDETFLEPEEFETERNFELLDEDIDAIDENYSKGMEETSIVTETLAEIYASQENFEEALDIYEKLKKLKPEFEEKFTSRIEELNKAIQNKKQKRFGN